MSKFGKKLKLQAKLDHMPFTKFQTINQFDSYFNNLMIVFYFY